MGLFVACKVEGCAGNAHYSGKGAHGYCARHSYRLRRHGSPLGGRTTPGEADRFLREVVFGFTGDECLIWPYARNSAGYGHLSLGGRNHLVHRLACEERNGPAPSPSAHAAHSCGKGHEGCCNPRHVRWATPSDNLRDRDTHGTTPRGERHYLAKLTADDVRAIRQSTESRATLARYHGVDPANITAVRNGRSWRHIQ